MEIRLLDHLRHPDVSVRRQAWKGIATRSAESSDNFERFCDLLRVETDPEARLQGLISLLESQPWRRRTDELNGWFFRPFADSRPRSSAVVAICDRQHFRDVQPLVRIARFLSAEEYPGTSIYHIPLTNPNWGGIGLHNLGAVCFLGRPTMFHDCDVIQQLQVQKHGAQLGFAPDDGRFRGAEVTVESAREFHHVWQRRRHRPFHLHKAEQYDGAEQKKRTDYAAVQRFTLEYGGKRLTVVILAGATSLGTVAATEWVTSPQLDQTLKDAADKVGEDMDEVTDLEVLLEATATFQSPSQPWEVASCKPLKLFFNGGLNALKSPGAITVCTAGEAVPSVLFDGDEIPFRGKGYSALVALCRKLLRSGTNNPSGGYDVPVDVSTRSVSIPELLEDRAVWPGGIVEAQVTKQFFHDNLQKYRLRDSLTIKGDRLILKCLLNEVSVVSNEHT